MAVETENVTPTINRELQRVQDAIREQLHHLDANDPGLNEILETFFAHRGKKLRPRLVLLSAFAMRGDDLRKPVHRDAYASAIAIAVAAELVHSASLIHDDVLDRELERRGGATINARFGDKVAILSGDILYSRVFDLLVQNGQRETILMLTACVRRMCRGEITNLTEHDFASYVSIIEAKTASLMQFCCRAGALTVQREDDDPDVMKALETFGYRFGMVYQLTDDLQDDDSPVVRRHGQRVRELLAEHLAGARAALSQVPESIYRDDLARLLDFVDVKAEPFMEQAVHGEVAMAAAVGH